MGAVGFDASKMPKDAKRSMLVDTLSMPIGAATSPGVRVGTA